MTEMVECPADDCEFGPAPPESVAGHFAGKRDESHAGNYQRAMSAIYAAEETGNQARSNGSGKTVDGSGKNGPIAFPDATDGSDGPDGCCESTNLAGQGGDVFQLESDEFVRLDEGEQICLNCDEIHGEN